jgi:hypothetical protein
MRGPQKASASLGLKYHHVDVFSSKTAFRKRRYCVSAGSSLARTIANDRSGTKPDGMQTTSIRYTKRLTRNGHEAQTSFDKHVTRSTDPLS